MTFRSALGTLVASTLLAGSALAEELTIGMVWEPTAIGPCFHNLGPNDRYISDSKIAEATGQTLNRIGKSSGKLGFKNLGDFERLTHKAAIGPNDDRIILDLDSRFDQALSGSLFIQGPESGKKCLDNKEIESGLDCNGTAHLIEYADILVAAAHTFYTPTGRLRADISDYEVYVPHPEGKGKVYKIQLAVPMNENSKYWNNHANDDIVFVKLTEKVGGFPPAKLKNPAETGFYAKNDGFYLIGYHIDMPNMYMPYRNKNQCGYLNRNDIPYGHIFKSVSQIKLHMCNSIGWSSGSIIASVEESADGRGYNVYVSSFNVGSFVRETNSKGEKVYREKAWDAQTNIGYSIDASYVYEPFQRFLANNGY